MFPPSGVRPSLTFHTRALYLSRKSHQVSFFPSFHMQWNHTVFLPCMIIPHPTFPKFPQILHSAYRSITSFLNNVEWDLHFSLCVPEPQRQTWVRVPGLPLTVTFSKLIRRGGQHVSSAQMSINWWMGKEHVAYPSIEYYLTKERNEVLTHATMRMNL